MYFIDKIKQFFKNEWKKCPFEELGKQLERLDEEIKLSDEAEVLDDGEDLVTLQLKLAPNMGLKMFCSWDYEQQSEEVAFAFGTLLKFLTNGGYDSLIIQAITGSVGEDENIDPKFVQSVLNTYQSDDLNKMQEKTTNMPLVSPLRTFNESNFGGMQ